MTPALPPLPDPHEGPSEDYRALVEGQISPEEYARRLEQAVAAEEESERATLGTDSDRADELLGGPSVFISYAHEDKSVARALALELEKRGAAVWIDEGALRVGDSILETVARAIADVEYVAVLVSAASVKSEWCRKELSLAATNVLARQGVKVLPVRLGDVDMPPALGDLFYLQVDESQLPDAAERLMTDIRRHHDDRLARGVPKRADVDTRPMPPSQTSWASTEEELVPTVLQAVRNGDNVLLSGLFNALPGAAGRAAVADTNAVHRLMNSATAVTAALIAHEAQVWAERGIRGFARIYAETLDQRGLPRQDLATRPEVLWLEIIVRIEALGGLAVRLEQWETVRSLALLPTAGSGETGYYPYVLRHGLTMAARAQLLQRRRDDQVVQVPLITLAAELAEETPALTPDLPPRPDAVVASICQFDALAALAAMGDADSVDGRFFYTNFAPFSNHATEPAIAKLITSKRVRDVLFPYSDEKLALAIQVLVRRATSEGFRFMSGWMHLQDERIRDFLSEHPVDEEAVRDAM